MTKYYFITGTDTNIGKTYITIGLLDAFKGQGYSTIAVKPVASGCIVSPNGLRNEDALLLQYNATFKLPYELVNPVAFEMPVAPHIAAYKANIALSVDMIVNKCQPVLLQPVNVVLMEGVGGWYVPLNTTQTMADVVKQLALEVILVVGIRLGCLNHTLLTYHAILSDKVKLKGWIANCIDPDMHFIDENIQTLSNSIKAPLLGSIPFGGLTEKYIDISSLI